MELTNEEVEEFNNDLKDFFEKLDIESKDYHDALRISKNGKTIILKENYERRVINYNPHFLLAWNINIYVQFCLDNNAVVTYITDYMTKGVAGLTRELTKALMKC